MVDIVRCSKGHKFPVNRKKHGDRDYVMCPHPGCHEQVKIRRRFKFLPNPKWEEEKLHSAAMRADLKRMKQRQGKEEPALAFPAAQALGVNLFALSMAIRRREEEMAAEKSSKQ